MRQKIKMIENAQHPHSSEMLKQITALVNWLVNRMTTVIVIGVVVAILLMIAWVSADGSAGIGLIIALLAYLPFAGVAGLLWFAVTFIQTLLTAKVKMLDTAYQTELLTALLVNQSCNAETPGAEAETEEAHKNPTTKQSAEKKEPVDNGFAVFSAEVNEGKICCPSCGKEQLANRKVCWYCGNKL